MLSSASSSLCRLGHYTLVNRRALQLSLCPYSTETTPTTVKEQRRLPSSAIYHKPIEALTHGPSVQHVVLNKFDIHHPDQIQCQDRFSDESLLYPLNTFVFGQPFRSDIIHRCVNFERSLMRSGSANTKTRSEVATSGRKLRPQKGSGKARIGDASSPALRKGGVAFGPKPKDWAQGIQRKVWELGIRTILSQRWREGRLIVVDEFQMRKQDYASEEVARLIKARGWGSAVLIAGGDWGTEATGWKDPGLLRNALSRSHLVEDGIRLGQKGAEWERIQRTKILPILNTIDLAHPADIRPGKPHPADLKRGAIGVYHLLLRKYAVLDIAAVRHLEHSLTKDLRAPITAIGVSNVEAHYQSRLAQQSLSSHLSQMLINPS